MSQYPDIVEHDFIALHNLCKPMTMTSVERLYALYNSVRYVAMGEVPGSFAECGVWKGGSVMMIALTLKSLGITDRDIYLYDTFEGMTPPTADDIDLNGRTADQLLASGDRENNLFWAYSPLDEVRENLAKTEYPMERFKFVRGDILATIPGQAPDRLALLRLDTDWYESTRHEMEHLFPRLSSRGVLIIDDYGHYRGSRKAVDEYLAGQPERYLMHRIDYTGRMLVKA